MVFLAVNLVPLQDPNCPLARRVPKEAKVLHLDRKDLVLTPTSLKEDCLNNRAHMANNNMREASARATPSPPMVHQKDPNCHHSKLGTLLNQHQDMEMGLACNLKGLLNSEHYHSKEASLLVSVGHMTKHLLVIVEPALLDKILDLLRPKAFLLQTMGVLVPVVSHKVVQPPTFHLRQSLCLVCP